MAGRARSGIDFIEIQQAAVKKAGDWVEMPDRRDPTNCKTCLRTDQRGIGLAQVFAGKGACFGRIHLIATGSDKQDRLAGCVASTDHRFGDLIQRTACRIGGLLCCACFGAQFQRGDRKPCGIQCRDHAFQALAHMWSVICRFTGLMH